MTTTLARIIGGRAGSRVTPGNPSFVGPENPQWKRNFAAKYWEPAWQAVFVGGNDSYLPRVRAAGFDGVYLDKVDEYEWFEEHGE
ncbi:MAG TPA: hypothetical protein VMV69_00525 [Pirellulales bacterium]|nr:hypothetical protein [Pirellulales bacterium]